MLKLSCETKMLKICFMYILYILYSPVSNPVVYWLLIKLIHLGSYFILSQQHAHTNTVFLKCFAIV